MSLRISRVGSASGDEWDAVWRQCDYATYFHGLAWAEIWSEYTDGRMRPVPCVLEFSDGARALLPLSRERIFRGLASRVLSSPAGTYGGWISATRLGAAHQALLTRWILGRHGSLVWRENPYASCLVSSDYDLRKEFTLSIDLSQGFDRLLQQWNRGHRSAIGKAMRAGVTIRLANSEDDWRAYYTVYEDSLRRWGDDASSRYDQSLFEILCRRAQSDPNIQLWLAMHQGHVIAGAICLLGPSIVVYWHGAALEHHFNLRPVNLLLHDAIRDAAQRGMTWFDFNPSGGHPGVENFKRGFGPVDLPASVISKNNKTIEAMQKIRELIK